MLYGKQPPLESAEVLSGAEAATGIDIQAFRTIRRAKQERSRLSIEQLNTVFDECFAVISKLGDIVNALEV